ncbi:MAG: hypothetical protein ACP5D2_01150 [Candidatus Nanoarchaeia archaeon]
MAKNKDNKTKDLKIEILKQPQKRRTIRREIARILSKNKQETSNKA